MASYELPTLVFIAIMTLIITIRLAIEPDPEHDENQRLLKLYEKRIPKHLRGYARTIYVQQLHEFEQENEA